MSAVSDTHFEVTCLFPSPAWKRPGSQQGGTGGVCRNHGTLGVHLAHQPLMAATKHAEGTDSGTSVVPG